MCLATHSQVVVLFLHFVYIVQQQRRLKDDIQYFTINKKATRIVNHPDCTFVRCLVFVNISKKQGYLYCKRELI